MIEPVDLPETSLILGAHFPTRDETAYRREARTAQTAAEASAGGRAVMAAQAGYTDAEFLGRTGSALGRAFTDRVDGFDRDHIRHTNVAAWLTWAADNIETTKHALNTTVREYHDSFDHAVHQAREHSWPQVKLNAAKHDLVEQAQQRVAAIAAGYEHRHTLARQGIAQGTPPPPLPPTATGSGRQ